DPIAGEGIDHQSSLVGRKDRLGLHVDSKDALVDPYDLVDERDPVGKARARSADRPPDFKAIEDSLGLAEPDHDCLLGFRNDRKTAKKQKKNDKADDCSSQWVPPKHVPHCCRSCSCCCCCCFWT